MTFNHANVVSSLPTNACCTNWIIDDGNVDKIPAKIMIEIPLPTPNCVFDHQAKLKMQFQLLKLQQSINNS